MPSLEATMGFKLLGNRVAIATVSSVMIDIEALGNPMAAASCCPM